MLKPNSKTTLLLASKDNFQRLNEYVDQLDKKDLEKSFPKTFLNRNVRDVLAHIHHWHLLFLGWYTVGMKGNKPAMPAEGYTWQTIGALNKEILIKYSNETISDVRKLINKTHKKVFAIIEKHSEEELFTKKKYSWTGSTSLGAYLISNVSSHYDWGLKIIKKGIR